MAKSAVIWEYPRRVIRGLSSVSVYRLKSKGQDSFCLVWYTGGERHRRVISDEIRANEEAEMIAEQLASGQLALTKVTRRDLEYYQTCERAVAPTPLHVVTDWWLRSHPSKIKSVPLAQAVKEFIAVNESGGRSTRHVQTLRHHLNTLAEDIVKPMDAVSAQELEVWLMAREWAARTRSNHITSFVSLWKWARDQGYVRDDVRTAADRLRRPRVRPADPEPFRPDELLSILRHVNFRAAPTVLIGAFAGIRQQEVARLTWADLDWKNGVILLSSQITKTSKRRTVPINDALRAWLQPLAVELEKRETRGPVLSLAAPHRWVSVAAQRAGVTWRQNGLRKGFVSYSMAQIKDPVQVSQITGHSVAELESSYKALVSGAEAAEWFGMRPGQDWHERVLEDVMGPHNVVPFTAPVRS